MALLKATRRIRISNSALNSYGFRLLTAGADLSLFEKNPILLWMHNRSWRGTDDEVLPIGRLEDILVEGDDITGLPCFDGDDPFAKKIYDKYEAGILNMSSVGFDPIETSNDPAHLLPGQRYETVTRWLLKELSIVDIGANREALALSHNGKTVVLNDHGDIPTDIIKPLHKLQNQAKMDLKEIATQLKLGDGATIEQVGKAVSTLLAEKNAAEGNVKTLKNELEALRAAEMNGLLETALEQGKITRLLSDSLKEDYKDNPSGLKKMLSALPAYKSISGRLDGHGNSDAAKFTALSWDELDHGGHLSEVKEHHPELYREKFKARFGRDPKM